MRKSLRLRLALIFVSGSLGTLLVVSGLLDWAFKREINQRNQTMLTTRIEELSTILLKHPEDIPTLEKEVKGQGSIALDPLLNLRILSGNNPMVETPHMADRLPAAWFQGQPKRKRHHRTFLMAQKQAGKYVIQGGLDITADEIMIHSFERQLFYTVLVGSGICAVFGWWAANRGLQPLRAIAESTREITADRLQQRLSPGQVPQELRHLVRAMNDMLDRLDRAFSRMSQFSSDLAHELRTPITNLMGEAEVTLSKERSLEEYRNVLESSLEEYRRLSRLITRMLFLARTENPQSVITRSTVDARKLVAEVLDYFDAASEEQGIHLTSEAEGTFLGDADMIRQALVNLVSNALDATETGGDIRIQVQHEAGQVTMTVQDTGRGIPSDEIPYLLDRFYRTRDAHHRRTRGTGLGLAIVRSIARLHGGDVDIESEVGKGTSITMRFPAA